MHGSPARAVVYQYPDPGMYLVFDEEQKQGGHCGLRPAITKPLRDRSGEVLFIDARNLGYMKGRVLRDFAPEDVERITKAFHSWQCELEMGEVVKGNTTTLVDPDPSWIYMDQPGFCYSATLQEIAKHDFVLTPGRYVGAGAADAETEPFQERMDKLTDTLNDQLSRQTNHKSRSSQILVHHGISNNN